MRLLALQPYDALSHRAFLDGWRRHSRHDFAVHALPGRHFKWRYRQAPIGLTQALEREADVATPCDALWCTSMLDLAALRGLCPAAARLPAVVYFHENQLVYPAQHADPRDIHFGLSQMTTALAAIASHRGASNKCVWWNSAYNRDSFLDALDVLLRNMPDHRPADAVETIRAHSAVHYPGIDPIDAHKRESNDPPTLLWAARWEHDKGPDLFFEALDELVRRGVAFRLNVVGQCFERLPGCFALARERFAERIDRWGFQRDRSAYHAALAGSDVVVSTSLHEFFGLAVAEAVSAGCVAVLPNALAYPEVWGDAALYHAQTVPSVADAIEHALARHGRENTSRAAERFAWSNVAPRLDDAIEALGLKE
jgi:glycosyltransferase involved in cell wall biosynthesis